MHVKPPRRVKGTTRPAYMSELAALEKIASSSEDGSFVQEAFWLVVASLETDGKAEVRKRARGEGARPLPQAASGSHQGSCQ